MKTCNVSLASPVVVEMDVRDQDASRMDRQWWAPGDVQRQAGVQA